MKKKIVVALLTTCVCASMLFGCGSTAAPATEAPAAEEPAAEAPADEKQEEATEAEAADDDQAKADEVAALIDAIYVQERTETTDADCKAAKEAWDALTDAQKMKTINLLMVRM